MIVLGREKRRGKNGEISEMATKRLKQTKNNWKNDDKKKIWKNVYSSNQKYQSTINHHKTCDI